MIDLEIEIREKIMIYGFFILYNNMNIDKLMCDVCIFSKKVQITYIARCICFLSFYEQSEDKYTLDYI